jgi:hypothetical protein
VGATIVLDHQAKQEVSEGGLGGTKRSQRDVMVAVAVEAVAAVDFEQYVQAVVEEVDILVIVAESGQAVQEDLIAAVWRMSGA